MSRRKSSYTPLFFLPLLFFLSSFHFPAYLHYEKRKLDGPTIAHILEFDPNYVEIKLVHANESAIGVERVSKLAKKHGAIAAINGSFFELTKPFIGISSGALKIQGEWYFSPRKERASWGWNQKMGEMKIDRLKMHASLWINDEKKYPVNGINIPRKEGSAVLYTFPFSPTTLTLPGIELTVDERGNPLIASYEGNAAIPFRGFVYSLDDGSPFRLPNLFPPFNLIHYEIELEPLNHSEDAPLWNEMENIVSGTPVLIDFGKICDFSVEKILSSFIYKPHPRTAVGIKENGHLIFLVVDGRIPSSIGMNLYELAEFLLSLGCVHAINLDGGASSTLYLLGEVVNTPCGAHEKDPEQIIGLEMPVGDAVLLIDPSAL